MRECESRFAGMFAALFLAAALLAMLTGCSGANRNNTVSPPPPPPAGAAQEGTWRALAPMPAARQELATALLNGKVMVMGGFDSSGADTDTVFAYDPQADRWSSLASLPMANDHLAAAVARGTLFAFGGVSNRVF